MAYADRDRVKLLAEMASRIAAGVLHIDSAWRTDVAATSVSIAQEILTEIVKREGVPAPVKGATVTCPKCGALNIEVIDDFGALETHYTSDDDTCFGP